MGMIGGYPLCRSGAVFRICAPVLYRVQTEIGQGAGKDGTQAAEIKAGDGGALDVESREIHPLNKARRQRNSKRESLY